MGKPKPESKTSRRGPSAFAAIVVIALLPACTGTQEEQGEREGQRAREDVRDLRDYIRDRGILIDTRHPIR